MYFFCFLYSRKLISHLEVYNLLYIDAVANFLREGAIGHHLVKAAYEGMREVSYTNLKSKMKITLNSAMF